MQNYPAPRAAKAPAAAVSYDTMSTGLITAMVLLPIPVILLVLHGNYAPRVKLWWSITAALETLAAVLLAAFTWYQLKDALAMI